MLVAASTDCFPDLNLNDTISRLVDLEYTQVEIVLAEKEGSLRPSQIAASVNDAVDTLRNTRRLDIVAYAAEIEATGAEHYHQFRAICQMAKATKVVSVTVPSAELGTPFNEEVEHLRRLVDIASVEGVLVSMRSQIGRLTEDLATVKVLCDNAKGLGLTLDPSHYIVGPHKGGPLDSILPYVYHVHLRDSSKEELHVRIGKGEVEYGKLIGQLRKVNYKRALCVHLPPLLDVEHDAEMRKMRLLLESLV